MCNHLYRVTMTARCADRSFRLIKAARAPDRDRAAALAVEWARAQGMHAVDVKIIEGRKEGWTDMIQKERGRDLAQMARNRLNMHNAMTVEARKELQMALMAYSTQSTAANYDHLERLLHD